MKLIHVVKTIILFILAFNDLRMFRKNWPELSPISEFENNFFID